jgi:hypothetical protein
MDRIAGIFDEVRCWLATELFMLIAPKWFQVVFVTALVERVAALESQPQAQKILDEGV